MSIELIAIIITGVVSGMDLMVNVVSMCMSGRSKLSCCCCNYDHSSDEVNAIDSVRRASVPAC